MVLLNTVMPVRTLLTAQRRHLADQLDALTEAEWDTPTLCAGWTVRHVVAHLVMPFRSSLPRFVAGMVRARGDFNRFADRVARRDAALPSGELTRLLRDNAEHSYKPPGAGYEAPLTDLVVHSLDITRPLGRPARIDPKAISIVLANLVTPRSVKFFGLDIAGLSLQATDSAWRHGRGVPVLGSSEDLVLALGGRQASFDLSGDGATRLLRSAP